MSIKIEFEFDRATTSALRYKEVGDNSKVGSLYLKKAAARKLILAEGDGLTVTLEKKEETK